jgi:ribosomal protein S27E
MYWRAKSFKQPRGQNMTDADIVQTYQFVTASKKRRHITEKKKIPMWSPAHFKNGYRCLVNVTYLHWFVADVDTGADYFVVCDRLKKAQFLFFAHCTWSWSDSLHKFRVALPLETSIPAIDWSVCWDVARDWFEDLTKARLDITTKDASRAYAVSAHQDRQIPPPMITDGYHLNLHQYCEAMIIEKRRQDAIKAELIARQQQLNLRPKTTGEIQNKQHNQNVTITDAEKRAIAQRVGAKIDGNYAKHIRCPNCGRSSVWFSLSGHIARCNHKNSCGYFAQITTL